MSTEEILLEVYREDWMSDDQWDTAMMLFEKTGVISDLEKAIKIGIRDGYSLDQQIKILKSMMKCLPSLSTSIRSTFPRMTARPTVISKLCSTPATLRLLSANDLL